MGNVYLFSEEERERILSKLNNLTGEKAGNIRRIIDVIDNRYPYPEQRDSKELIKVNFLVAVIDIVSAKYTFEKMIEQLRSKAREYESSGNITSDYLSTFIAMLRRQRNRNKKKRKNWVGI